MGVENLWEKRPYLQQLGSTLGNSTEEAGMAQTVRRLSPLHGPLSGWRNCSQCTWGLLPKTTIGFQLLRLQQEEKNKT